MSRTHGVALDWLFDGINVDPKIQIKFVDTKTQLADMLTKGNFTRDEWNHLLRFRLFNIMNFSMFSCSHFFQLKAEHHVEETSGKNDRRRTVGGEIGASMFGIKKPERKAIFLVGFGCFIQPRELRVGSELCVHEIREIGAGQSPKTQQRVLKSGKEMNIRALGDQCER